MLLSIAPGKIESSSGSILTTTTTWGARFAVLALTTLLAAGLSFADGKKHKLSKDLDTDTLKGGHNGATVDVIIQFNQTPTAAHHQKVQDKGGVLKTSLDVIKGAHYSVPTGSLEDLENDPDVAYISPNRPLSGTATSTLDYTRETVNAQVALQQWGLDGTSIGVAVIDSGVTAVGDLYWWIPSNQTYGSRVVYSQNFVPGTTDSSDQYGHGTHVWDHCRCGLVFHRFQLHSHIQRDCPECKHHQPARFGPKRCWYRQQCDCGDPNCHQLEIYLQHPCNQPFARAPSLRKLSAGSTLPGS